MERELTVEGVDTFWKAGLEDQPDSPLRNKTNKNRQPGKRVSYQLRRRYARGCKGKREEGWVMLAQLSFCSFHAPRRTPAPGTPANANDRPQ